jgi:hypothetical protein
MTTPDPHPSPTDPDELAPLDDVVIGRAFRWSFIALVTLLAAGAGLYLVLKPRTRTADTQMTQLSAPIVPQKPVAEVPAAKFTDISANGHLEDEIAKIQKSQTYAQPAQLVCNAGADQGGFLVVPPHKVGGDLFKPIVGRSSAYADIDGDSDLDVVLTQVGGPPLLLRNDQALGHHWLRVKLLGHPCNRDAIGAWVTLRAGGITQTRQVMPTRSYLSQSELPVTFGLGRFEQIDSLEITWPGGGKQVVEPRRVDRLCVIKQYE